MWGEHSISLVSNCCYLGIDLASDGRWDVNQKKVISNGKKKLNQPLPFLAARVNYVCPPFTAI